MEWLILLRKERNLRKSDKIPADQFDKVSVGGMRPVRHQADNIGGQISRVHILPGTHAS